MLSRVGWRKFILIVGVEYGFFHVVIVTYCTAKLRLKKEKAKLTVKKFSHSSMDGRMNARVLHSAVFGKMKRKVYLCVA